MKEVSRWEVVWSRGEPIIVFRDYKVFKVYSSPNCSMSISSSALTIQKNGTVTQIAKKMIKRFAVINDTDKENRLSVVYIGWRTLL